MNIRYFRKYLVFLLTFFMFLKCVNATGTGLLKDVGIEITDDKMVEVELNLDDYQTNIKYVTQCTSLDSYSWTQVVPNGNCTLIPNVSKYIYYKNAINYYGLSLDLRIDIVRKTEAINPDYKNMSEGYTELITTDYYNSVMVMPDKRIRIHGVAPVDRTQDPVVYEKWINNTRTEVKYSFYKDGEPFNMRGLVGIIDPDGANYLFDINRSIYYVDAPHQFEDPDKQGVFDEIYEVTSEGLFRNDTAKNIENGEQLPYWDDAIIALKIQGEPNITITFDFADDLIKTPIFYTLSEKYNVYYVLNDSVDNPATNNSNNPTEYMSGDEKNILNPTRPGYVFLGWEEGNKINKWDFGDKTFTARWEKIEYRVTTDVRNGTIDPSITVSEGENITINYSPNSGYVLKKILVDDVEVSKEEFSNNYAFTNINANHTIYVEYKPAQGPEYVIITDVKNGEIDPPAYVYDGENITINYKPKPGYIIKKLEVDGRGIDINNYPNNYTFSSVSSDHTIYVEYEIENPQTGTGAYIFIPMLFISFIVMMYVSKRKLSI